MDGLKLQDQLSKGWGVAARRIGTPYIAYRPSGQNGPLNSSNRVIKLYAAFSPINTAQIGTIGYAGVLWRGIFDSSYTMPGDYLRCLTATFFIAAQWPMQPVLCVQTGNIITIARPQPVAIGSYSGFVLVNAQQIATEWPAMVTMNSARISGSLPESKFGNWSAFLPILPTAPEVADVITDDLGRRFVVGGAQLSNLGWRLSMRQVDG